MNNLPNDIIINILIKKHASEMADILKKMADMEDEKNILIKQNSELEEDLSNCMSYLSLHEVKYCEECNQYGTDDEIICYDDGMTLCESCKEYYDSHRE
tara:strand:- start:104 stop:400 length:297 start_codon:yes stop_codon:yes gene_type:complete